MGDFLAALIEMICAIWQADSEIRDRSVMGESEMERRSRRLIVWWIGGIMAALAIAGFAWWWFTRSR